MEGTIRNGTMEATDLPLLGTAVAFVGHLGFGVERPYTGAPWEGSSATPFPNSLSYTVTVCLPTTSHEYRS